MLDRTGRTRCAAKILAAARDGRPKEVKEHDKLYFKADEHAEAGRRDKVIKLPDKMAPLAPTGAAHASAGRSRIAPTGPSRWWWSGSR